MKKILLFVFIFISIVSVYAQVENKMNFALRQIMQAENLPPANVLVKGDIGQLKIFLN
jgi:hypothetical protein